MTVVSAT